MHRANPCHICNNHFKLNDKMLERQVETSPGSGMYKFEFAHFTCTKPGRGKGSWKDKDRYYPGDLNHIGPGIFGPA